MSPRTSTSRTVRSRAPWLSERQIVSRRRDVVIGERRRLVVRRRGAAATAARAARATLGVTRATTLAGDLGLQVREQDIPREALYVADELFFTGTAAEITPIRSVDKVEIGTGKRGVITARLQSAFFDYVNGVVPDRHGWLVPVEVGAAAAHGR